VPNSPAIAYLGYTDLHANEVAALAARAAELDLNDREERALRAWPNEELPGGLAQGWAPVTDLFRCLLGVKTSPDDPETGTSEIFQKADIPGARWHVSKVRQPIYSRAIAVRLNRFAAFHHMKFDPGGDRTRW
jgi:hypothetical protein